MSIDREVQTSLHGRRLGLSKDGNLVGDGGIVALRESQFAVRVRMFDDFLGKTISTMWDVQKGSDGGTVNFAILAGATSGAVRGTTGAGGTTTMAVNGVQLDGALNFKAANGPIVMEANLQVSAITNLAIFVGFTDQVAALEMPWTLSVVTFTSNQSDGAGFLFDTAATAVTIRAVGVKGDTDATSINSGLAYVAATNINLKVTIDTAGTATFMINGVTVGTMVNAVTTTVAMTPVIAAFSRAAGSINVDVDFIRCDQDR